MNMERMTFETSFFRLIIAVTLKTQINISIYNFKTLDSKSGLTENYWVFEYKRVGLTDWQTEIEYHWHRINFAC